MSLKNIFLKNSLLLITFILFAFSLVLMPDISAMVASIDIKVIESLLCMMLIGAAAEKEGLLDFAAKSLIKNTSHRRSLALILSAVTGFFAMFITNDIALLIIVPIVLKIAEKADFDPFKIIALITVAANLGSSLLPMGNPQNIFIFNFFNVNPFDFIITIFPIVIMGAFMIYLAALTEKKLPLKKQSFSPVALNYKRIKLYFILFSMIILGIFRVFDLNLVTALIIASFFIMDKELFKKVDYPLLILFLLFFMIIHNISGVEAISKLAGSHLETDLQIMLTCALTSQFISNVPSAILISPFVGDFAPVLIGVSIGGLGTMIASLANLISYRLYIQKYPKGHYISYFSKINFAMLALFLITFFFIGKIF